MQASIASSVSSSPDQNKREQTTIRLCAEARAVADSMPYGSLNKTLEAVLLALGRQRRDLPGVGPREIKDFLSHLGVPDVDVPPEYKSTPREREQQRVEKELMVGLNRFSWEQLPEACEVLQVEQLPEETTTHLSAPLLSIEEIAFLSPRLSELVALALVYCPAHTLERLRKDASRRSIMALEDELQTLVDIYSSSSQVLLNVKKRVVLDDW